MLTSWSAGKPSAFTTTILIPIVFIFVPESVQWLTQRRPAGALERVNQTLRRMGHDVVAALPAVAPGARKLSIADVFRPGLVHITVLVTLAYFFHITTFYFIMKWVPKIITDFGFPPSSAAGVLVWANVGGMIGGALWAASPGFVGTPRVDVIDLRAGVGGAQSRRLRSRLGDRQ